MNTAVAFFAQKCVWHKHCPQVLRAGKLPDMSTEKEQWMSWYVAESSVVDKYSMTVLQVAYLYFSNNSLSGALPSSWSSMKQARCSVPQLMLCMHVNVNTPVKVLFAPVAVPDMLHPDLVLEAITDLDSCACVRSDRSQTNVQYSICVIFILTHNATNASSWRGPSSTGLVYSELCSCCTWTWEPTLSMAHCQPLGATKPRQADFYRI